MVSIPYTIVRSTQFMEFVDGIADSATTGNEVHMAPVAFQPIAAVDVARAVTDAAVAAPVEWPRRDRRSRRLRFDEVIGRKLGLRNDPRVVVSDPDAIYFGSVPSEDSLVPLNGARLGSIHYEEWLTLPTTR